MQYGIVYVSSSQLISYKLHCLLSTIFKSHSSSFNVNLKVLNWENLLLKWCIPQKNLQKILHVYRDLFFLINTATRHVQRIFMIFSRHRSLYSSLSCHFPTILHSLLTEKLLDCPMISVSLHTSCWCESMAIIVEKNAYILYSSYWIGKTVLHNHPIGIRISIFE